MADTDNAPVSVEALQEELTVQKVVLDSLAYETFEGAEDLRQDARVEMDRIQKLLQSVKQKRESRIPAANLQHTPERHIADVSPSGSEDVQSEEPSAMYTAFQNDSRADGFGTFSLPNRKRGADSARLSIHDNHAKARRTSPASRSNPFSTPSTTSNIDNTCTDFIDLTGDDDDEDGYGSDVVAKQIRAQEMHRQEREDLELAQMLSSQDSPHRGAAPQAPQANAFTRLMTSQPPAAAAALNQEEDWDAVPGPSNQTPMPTQESSLYIPGSYDTSWDDPFDDLDMSQLPLANQYRPLPSSSYSRGPTVKEDPQVTFAGSVATANAARNAAPIASGMGYPDVSRGRSVGYGPFAPLHAAHRLGSSAVPGSLAAGSTLGDIISRTRGYASGDPLPGPLADMMQHSFHGPEDEKQLEDLLKNISADAPDSGDEPPGLKRPLYPHQKIALAWMKKMEQGSNKGGILADDMGLGKTISTLALLLARPATARPKTNLIIAPVALIRQWEEEIATKTKLSHRLSVYIHHNRKTTTDELLRYDVVLTTYGTIAQEVKRLEKLEEEARERKSKINWNDKTLQVKCPLLHQGKAIFHRVILDEAQCIKNKETRTAKACTRVKAAYRWCLTGTPMMNGVLELYSLVKFLNIRPYCTWEEFRQAFGTLFGRNGDKRSIAMGKLRVLLKAIMLRRKKTSQLNGKPILTLPEKTEEIVYADLSTEERDFYTQLEKYAKVQFSKYLREGSIGKNYSNILVLLLRLRQACCHPHLNLDVEDAAPPSVSDEDKADLVKQLDQAIVQRIKGVEAFECPICYDAVQCPSFFIPCGHDSCGECLVRIVDNASAVNLQEGHESARAKCPVCRGVFDPSKCFSYEIFRQVHMPETIDKKPDKESGVDDDYGSDSETESDYESDDEVDKKGNLKDFIVNDEISDEEGEAPARKKRKGKGKGKGKVSDVKPSMLKTLRKEAYKNQDAFKKYMRYLRKTWEPAAKVTECMGLLKQIGETGEKTIIFSQWTLLLDLLSVAMWHEKMVKPERYDGSMSATQRNMAAHKFRDRKGVNVMLVSLRAGNAGLNLTAASRVIIMDPFWNPYIEMQAVDRAYRIGQQKEVKVYRILTKGTVEDRIVDLQNKKKEIVEAALDENEGGKIARLSINDLKFLFNTRD
ncbi:hypothetical protein F66182_9596 [Fusarium sp. NRRL 66182]|nr:hypothetical protein F66182_9596 [Fusarium sp. NRRL 66182]